MFLSKQKTTNTPPPPNITLLLRLLPLSTMIFLSISPSSSFSPQCSFNFFPTSLIFSFSVLPHYSPIYSSPHTPYTFFLSPTHSPTHQFSLPPNIIFILASPFFTLFFFLLLSLTTRTIAFYFSSRSTPTPSYFSSVSPIPTPIFPHPHTPHQYHTHTHTPHPLAHANTFSSPFTPKHTPTTTIYTQV